MKSKRIMKFYYLRMCIDIIVDIDSNTIYITYVKQSVKLRQTNSLGEPRLQIAD